MAPRLAPRFISVLASRLASLAERNDVDSVHDMRRRQPKKLTGFDCRHRPTFSVEDYLMTIFQEFECSPCCYMAAFIYISRFCYLNNIFIDPFNAHCLMLTSVVVAIKFWEDDYDNNALLATLNLVALQRLNAMELEFLFGIDFRLFITEVEFHNQCRTMQVEIDAQHPDSRLQLPRFFYEEDGDDTDSDGDN